jgi:hypothetical protein
MKEIFESLVQILSSNDLIINNEFNILKDACALINSNESEYAQDVVLRLLERKNQFSSTEAKKIITALARQAGLFPYMNLDEASFADAFAYHFFKPEGLSNTDIVFHRPQAEIYHSLLAGENVILSAPTSFGKSLIIDALVASNKYDNIVIVVPTIALIDETRKRLSDYKESYKLITHSNQKQGEKNLFILTQERIIEFWNSPVDLFIIDEFYKLQPTLSDQDRSYVLNHAFYKLYNTKAQFYLLGPAIEGIILPKSIPHVFKSTRFKTVISEFIRVPVQKEEPINKLVTLCKELQNESTLIYCASPNSAIKVALSLAKDYNGEHLNSDFVEWLEESFHKAWSLPFMISKGIGVHHGKMPRSISQIIVKLFNEGKIRVLVCTSTLIEGVNTKAKNVIIYDNIVAQRKLDFFTFNNICGRSGRMYQHFIGKIYLFHERPISNDLFVDFPIMNQGTSVPSKLLIQINEEDLSSESREKIAFLKEQDLLTIDLLRKNNNISPEAQLSLAQDIIDNLASYYENLYWSGNPEYKQLEQVCSLIWKHFQNPKRTVSVKSGKHLCYRIWRFTKHRSFKKVILSQINRDDTEEQISHKIDDELDFIRLWVTYSFPRYLRVLDSILKELLPKLNVEHGDYTDFTNQIEHLFTDPTIAALDEYGIPFQIAVKIQQSLNPNGDLDQVLLNLKNLDINSHSLSSFERMVLQEAKQYL